MVKFLISMGLLDAKEAKKRNWNETLFLILQVTADNLPQPDTPPRPHQIKKVYMRIIQLDGVASRHKSHEMNLKD